MLFAMLSSLAYDFEVNGLYYTVISEQELTCEISKGPKDFKYSGKIKIPTEVSYNGKTLKVVGIGQFAFSLCDSLTSIDIPNSITRIEKWAFNKCTSLASVDIPNSVTTIEDAAFCHCSSLTNIEIPNSVLEMKPGAFDNCTSLISVKIPNSITTFNTFNGCTSLTSVEIPNSVKEFSGFVECYSLKSVKIPNSVTKIKYDAFYKCTSLASIHIPESVEEIGNYAFSNTPLTSINIPGKVKQLGPSAFQNCTQLDTIYFERGADTLNLMPKAKEKPCFYNTGKIKTIVLDRNIVADGYDAEINDIVYLTIGDSISVKQLFCHNFRNLQSLVLGKDVVLSDRTGDSRYISSNFNNRPILQTLTLKDEVPTFTIQCADIQYKNIRVGVPFGALQAYKNAEGWKNFWSIEETDKPLSFKSTNITGEKTVCGKYDIYGQPIDDSYKGLIIIQYSDGTTEKVLNRCP